MSPGASRSMPKMTIDMPSRVSAPTPSRCAMYVFTMPAARGYLSRQTSAMRPKL